MVAVQGAAEALAPVGLAPASENRENFTAWKALLRVVLSFCDARVSGGEGGGPLEAVREETVPDGETLPGSWPVVCIFEADIPRCSCSVDSPIPGSFTRFAIPESSLTPFQESPGGVEGRLFHLFKN